MRRFATCSPHDRGLPWRRPLLISCIISFLFTYDAAASSARKSRPNYRGTPISVVDMHMHPGTYEDMGPIGKAFLRRTLPGFLPDSWKDMSLSLAAKILFDPYGLIGGIKSECDSAQVDMCGLFAVYAPETWGVTTNKRVIQWLDDPRNRDVQGKPFFFGLASVSMQDWPAQEEAALNDLRSGLQHHLMKGIKLAFIHNSIPLDDPKYASIYDVAEEFQVPVYHHVGSSPLRKLVDFSSEGDKKSYIASYDPSNLERVIAAHPRLTFILGHVGFDFNQEGYDFQPEVYALAERYPNVYLEISGFGTPFHDPKGEIMETVLKSIKARKLVDRVLFGSDGPTVPGGAKAYVTSTLKAMDRMGYTHDEAETVLARNAKRLFKLEQ